ncbi:hypothetical protein SKAU_G00415360 [Synaphobranchus kaupii]|uniref:Uncharacterized protein n=1 Tax=Synaphobranchus kaupii TaxID=118154 RepID=A0A9Q1E775_SYNKA|nr:hypothetical protein SKAU_G00415360 [Synaphobranchus kaupii]
MLRPILLKHRENIDNRQSRYVAAGEQWEQERPGKEMETDNQFGGAGDERERQKRARKRLTTILQVRFLFVGQVLVQTFFIFHFQMWFFKKMGQ